LPKIGGLLFCNIDYKLFYVKGDGMRAKKVLLAVLVASIWGLMGTTPGIAGGGAGGVFQDLLPGDPAYQYVVFLLERKIITPDPSGTFKGSEPLTRATGAIWIARAVQYLEGKIPAAPTGDVTGLTQKVTALETRIRQVEQELVQTVREVQNLKSTVTSLSNRVAKLEQQGPAQVQGIAGRAQLALIVGITGVVLALAALALQFF